VGDLYLEITIQRREITIRVLQSNGGSERDAARALAVMPAIENGNGCRFASRARDLKIMRWFSQWRSFFRCIERSLDKSRHLPPLRDIWKAVVRRSLGFNENREANFKQVCAGIIQLFAYALRQISLLTPRNLRSELLFG
jgi:hypothetical protein